MRIESWEKKISNLIYNWCMNNNEKILNLVSIPHNSSRYLLKTIMEYASNGRKVMYITEEREGKIELVEDIKKHTDFRGYSYVRRDADNSRNVNNLVICDFNSAMEDREWYDLVICNDVSSMSVHSKEAISETCEHRTGFDGKVIYYSIEAVRPETREIVLPVNRVAAPQPEPRIITTRVDLKKDIPFVVYDYLSWSLKQKRKVVIYVPSEDEKVAVFEVMKRYGNRLTKNVFCLENNKGDQKILDSFSVIKEGIVVTDDHSMDFSEEKHSDIMVFFANDDAFNYKSLAHICSSAGSSLKDPRREVILVANSESSHMTMARDILRGFNKEAWEINLLNM